MTWPYLGAMFASEVRNSECMMLSTLRFYSITNMACRLIVSISNGEYVVLTVLSTHTVKRSLLDRYCCSASIDSKWYAGRIIIQSKNMKLPSVGL